MATQQRINIVFYYDPATQDIQQGLPEQYPAPYGYQKIVCTSAHEAERWSSRLRKWEHTKQAMEDEQREMVEGPIRDNIRRHIQHQMANARNAMNRDFLRKHLEAYDKRADLTRTKRVSYLHAEAYENGK